MRQVLMMLLCVSASFSALADEAENDPEMVLELPFSPHDLAKCSDARDQMLTFDTPDGDDDGEVYAPASGVAYVYSDDRDGGLGVYVKIDQGDGTYVLVGHLHDAAVLNAQLVQAGQLLGWEGIEGTHNGHDVLLGYMVGSARDPTMGEPRPFFLHAAQGLAGAAHVLSADQVGCGEEGSTYRSQLHWRNHPPDDLEEGHDWIRVYGENLWIDPFFHDGRWFVFPEGAYRIDLSGRVFWAHVARECQQSGSVLCHADDNNRWSLCFDSSDGEILPADRESICRP